MTIYYVGIQGSYKQLDIALFKNKKHVRSISRVDGNASSHLITDLDQLLRNYNLSLDSLSFIALDHGPGAFTSLRVTLATLNAIGFTKKVPLIGIDGLSSLAYESHKDSTKEANFSLALLNAYGGDLYATLYRHHDDNSLECILPNFVAPIHECLDRATQHISNQTVHCIGNGVETAKTELIQAPKNFRIPLSVPMVSSGAAIAELGFMQWEKGQAYNKIVPYYLKLQQFRKKQR